MGVDGAVVLRADELEAPVVAESAPFSVDDHLLRFVVIAVPQSDVLQALDVASVRSGAHDETNAASGILPGARHQRPSRVVQSCHYVDFDVTAPKNSLLIKK